MTGAAVCRECQAESGHGEHLGERHIVADPVERERHWGEGQDHALGSRALQCLHAVARTLRNKQTHCCSLCQGQSPSQAVHQVATTSSSSAIPDVASLIVSSCQRADSHPLLSYGQHLSCGRTSVLPRPISTSPA